MQFSSNNSQFFVSQLVWIGIPISLVAILGTFLLLNFYLSRMISRMGGIFSPPAVYRSSLKYYFIRYGTHHRQNVCLNVIQK